MCYLVSIYIHIIMLILTDTDRSFFCLKIKESNKNSNKLATSGKTCEIKPSFVKTAYIPT